MTSEADQLSHWFTFLGSERQDKYYQDTIGKIYSADYLVIEFDLRYLQSSLQF